MKSKEINDRPFVTANMGNNQDKQKNILIVDDERHFLLSLKASLETYSSYFNVLMAENGKTAIGILESENIDLIVTDLRMPEMDGFELLAYMSINFPSIPTIVTSAFGTPQIKERLETMGTLRFLEKPIDFHDLAKAVTDGLAYDLKSGSLSGISICSFLQLIEIEEKTCLLEVFKEDKDQKGFFYFNTGNLHDAIYGDLKGEDAALEMVSWDNVEIRFKDLPKRRIKNRINRELIALIVDGMRLKDESKYTEIDDQDEKEDIEASNGKDLSVEEDTAIYEAGALISESSEEEELRVPEGLEILDEKESQKESMAIEETGGKGHNIKEEFSTEEEGVKPSQMENHTTKSERRIIVPKLNDILKEMADEADSALALLVVSTDGNVIAKHCLTGNPVDELAAKFAMIMKMVEKSLKALGTVGEFEENLAQTDMAWILTRFLTENTFLAIAISREGTLGSARLVSQKYADKLRESL